MVRVKKYPKMGRGLQATRDIEKGEVIEKSEILLFDRDEQLFLSNTILNLYVFYWNKKEVALAFGNGSLFNHSDKDNVSYENDYRNKKIVFKALRKIRKGEQLFLNYGYNPVESWKDYVDYKGYLRKYGK